MKGKLLKDGLKLGKKASTAASLIGFAAEPLSRPCSTLPSSKNSSTFVSINVMLIVSTPCLEEEEEIYFWFGISFSTPIANPTTLLSFK